MFFQKEVLLLLFCSLCLAACDKGQKIVDRMNETNADVLNKKLDSESFVKLQSMFFALTVVEEAYPEKASATEAKEIKEKILQRVRERMEELNFQSESIVKDFTLQNIELEDKIAPIHRMAQAAKDRITYKTVFSLREEQCFALAKSTSEFSGKSLFYRTEILKVKKLGKEEFLAEPVFSASPQAFKNPELELKRQTKDEPHYKISSRGAALLDCEKATEIARIYKTSLEKAVLVKKTIEEANSLKNFYNRRIQTSSN